MEISPIAGVCGVSLLKSSQEESFVPPAFAVDASGRTGDDTYGASGEDADRELQDDEVSLDSGSDAGAGEGEN